MGLSATLNAALRQVKACGKCLSTRLGRRLYRSLVVAGVARVSALCFEAPTVSFDPETLACRVHCALFIPFFPQRNKGSHTIAPAVNFRRWMYDTCRKGH